MAYFHDLWISEYDFGKRKKLNLLVKPETLKVGPMTVYPVFYDAFWKVVEFWWPPSVVLVKRFNVEIAVTLDRGWNHFSANSGVERPYSPTP